MAKLGRNDPCSCGSGKKYKNCCLFKAEATPLADRLPDYLKPELIARKWMGTTDEASARPLKDARGKALQLVMDRFDVSDAEAIRQVKALGRQDGETVLFFDEDRWIGEADLSIAGQIRLVTPGPDLADRLCALLQPIEGLERGERQVDTLPALDRTPSSGGEGLLEFKRTFFTAWLDEPNQKLTGSTPRQASLSAELRPSLLRLLADLEAKEARNPKAERFLFDELRAQLGVLL